MKFYITTQTELNSQTHSLVEVEKQPTVVLKKTLSRQYITVSIMDCENVRQSCLCNIEKQERLTT